MFELALQLERHGRLGQLHTSFPARWVPGLSRRSVSSLPWLLLGDRLASKVSERARRAANRGVIAGFDASVARRLRGASVVTALSSFGTKSLRTAKSQGSAVVCDRGSWHILEQQRVLVEESDKWGMPGPEFDDWIIERELSEYELVDAIFVPSRPALDSFVRRGVPPNKLRLVPYGVDATSFTPPRERRLADRVICVGRLDLRKGHQYLVPAYRRIRRPGTDLVLLGPVDTGLAHWLDLDNDADIHVVGAVKRTEVARWMQSSSIFALASIEEGLALVVPQAMACGLPVVVSEATGAADLISHGVHGLVVPTGDEDAFADALQQLLGDPERARAMGDAARCRIGELGGWRTYGDIATAAFAGLASPKATPPSG